MENNMKVENQIEENGLAFIKQENCAYHELDLNEEIINKEENICNENVREDLEEKPILIEQNDLIINLNNFKQETIDENTDLIDNSNEEIEREYNISYYKYECNENKSKDSYRRRIRLKGTLYNEKYAEIKGVIICQLCGNMYVKKEEFLLHASTKLHLKKKKCYKNEVKKKKGERRQTITRSDSIKEEIISKDELKKEKPDIENSTQGIDDISIEGKVCIRRNYSNVHLSQHIGKKPFKCEICSKSFLYKSNLSSHMKFHTGKNLYQCENCSKSYAHKYLLINHIRKHTGEKPFKCDICSKGFPAKENLQKHIKYCHTGEKHKHQCEVCLKKFVFKRELKSHMSLHKDENLLKCQICSKLFSQDYLFPNDHTEEKPFKCEICSKSSPNEEKTRSRSPVINTCSKSLPVEDNSQSFENLHKCDVCSRYFQTLSSLNKHLLQHTGEKPFKCEMCSKSFFHKGNLNSHMKIHTGKNLYRCETCSKSYVHKYLLINHVRKHTGEKPFKCDICLKSFPAKVNLSKHEQSHWAKNRYKCDICSKCFSSVSTLNCHLISHEVDEPLNCDLCSTSFQFEDELNSHMRFHTGEPLKYI